MEAGTDVGHVPALEAVCSLEGRPLPAELLRLFWCRQSAAGNFFLHNPAPKSTPRRLGVEEGASLK